MSIIKIECLPKGKDNWKRVDGVLDSGKKNLGYTAEEAIKEAIDDSQDAYATNIGCHFFEEEYEIPNTNIQDKEYGYLVADDGTGIINLENIFNFGKQHEKKHRYSSKEEYLSKVGKFSYGLISHINVASEVMVYTKLEEENWKVIRLYYDEIEGDTFVSEVREVEREELTFLEIIDFPIHRHGTIVVARGLEDRGLFREDKKKFIEDLKRNLSIGDSREWSVKYLYVDNEAIRNVDVFGYNVPCEIKSEKFLKLEITLEDIWKESNKEIDKKKIVRKFINIMSEEELKKRAIEIELYALNPIFKMNYADIPMRYKEKAKESIDYVMGQHPEYEVIQPTIDRAGFYLFRNNKLIGTSLALMDRKKPHPSDNYFRGKINIEPCFDSYFGIQINKNRNKMMSIIKKIITNKIIKSLGDKGENLSGTLNKTIEAIHQRVIKEYQEKYPEELAKPNQEENASKKGQDISGNKDEEEKRKRIELQERAELAEKIKHLREKISCQYYYKDEKTTDLMNRVEQGDVDIKEAKDELELLKSHYQDLKIQVFDDLGRILQNSKNHVKRRRIIREEEENSANVAKGLWYEPQQEVELGDKLTMAMHIYPEEFSFSIDKKMTDSGLDLLMRISSEDFEELNLKERYSIQMKRLLEELPEEYSKEIPCLGELKLRLPKNMNHSLFFVAYIICWDKPKFKEISAIDGTYTFTDSTKKMLIGESLGIKKKVKVVYLKDLIEEKTGLKYT